MDEISLLNLFIGFVISIGLMYLMLLLWKVIPYLKKSRIIMLIPVTGGISTLLGIWALRIMKYPKENPNSLYPLLILAGIFMIVLPLVELRLFRFDKLLVLQIFLVILSLSTYDLVHVWWNLIPGTFALAALLFLIRFPLFLMLTSPFGRILVNLASWLWVIFSWLRYYLLQAPFTCTLYILLLIPVTSLLLWDFSVVIAYENTRRCL